MDDGGSRWVPALLMVVLMLGGAAGLAATQMMRPAETTDTEPEPSEPEPPVEQPSICLDGQIQYAWSCIWPLQSATYQVPGTLSIGEELWVEPVYDGDEANAWWRNCSGAADALTFIAHNETLRAFSTEPGQVSCEMIASNPVSQVNSSFNLTFILPPPTGLAYEPDGWVLRKGAAMTAVMPVVNTLADLEFTVAPDLPAGITLDAQTGRISGVPTHLQGPSNHTIWANHSGGSTSTMVDFAVIDFPVSGLMWAEMDLVLTKGEAMVPMAAQYTGGEPLSFEVDPPMPAGISLDGETGRIAGTPLVLQPEQEHWVWANNSGGARLVLLEVTVNDAPVDSIVYARDPLEMVWQNDSVDMTPMTTGGAPVSWQIEPALPVGLSFDVTTGRIHGSADTVYTAVHTITASNTGGDFALELLVYIADLTPAGIDWGETTFVLVANESVALVPTNEGPAITEWSVHPALPAGLSLNASNGAIEGAAVGRTLDRHAWTVHTVWANNSGGSLSTNLTFAVHDLDADHAALTSRPVGQVDFGGAWPSILLPIGEWAFSLGLDWDDRAISAASHVEKGRMVGYGHETMVARTGDDGRANLSLNALDWVCDGRTRVGLEGSFNGWKDTLLAEGYSVTESATPADLSNLDCFVTEFWNAYSDAENAQIESWLTAGGGMVMGGHAWYWSYSNSDAPNNYPGNRIARTTGIMVSTSSGSSTFDVPTSAWGDHYRLHGALPLIEAHFDGTALLTGSDAEAVAKTVRRCAETLPMSYARAWSALWEASNQTGWILINSSSTFDMDADHIDTLVLKVQERLTLLLPAAEVPAHPGAVDFPGTVPAAAPRVTETVSIDGDFAGLPSGFGYANARADGRMSTGLYAAPGEVVNVTFPSHIVDTGVNVLVGAHSDWLWGKDTLSRHPYIVRSWPATNTTIQVANAWGGILYVRVPAGSSLGMFNVTFEGAVESPLYVHGQTALNDWQNAERHKAAPIAELASGSFILTVSSSEIRALDDPDYAMDFWDEALEMEHELSGYTPWPRVERATFDVQISAGWMHSGYPFMAHLASIPAVVNGTHMYANGDWGMFHELGHNHQWMASTLPGNTETTCNLYSVRLMEDLVGVSGHGAISPSSREQRTENHFANGAPLSSWSVWTALETHLLVKEAFGWGPITEALDQYYWGNISTPSGDVAEFNTWAVQTSLSTGYNLMPYYSAWNFPLTSASWQAVDHLPVWNTDPLRGWVHEYDLISRNHTASNVSGGAADLEWHVYDNGTNTTMTVCWGWQDGGNNTLTWANCASKGTPQVGDVSHFVNGLTSGVSYKWRVMGANGNGQTWSDVQSFTAA